MIANGNTYCKTASFSPVLPTEYQEVEYVESTGTQWIDTGVTSSYNLEIEADLAITEEKPTSSRSYRSLFGNISSWVMNLVEDNTGIRWVGQDINMYVTTYIVNQKFNIKAGNTYCKINNVSITRIADVNNVSWGNFYIGKGYYSNIGKAKFYNFQIYNNGELIRNFIPCYRKSDNEIGMYDTVNKVFYTNQGTGTFLKGNNVVHTIRYNVPCEETVYHIRGTATDNFDFTLKYIDKNNNITTVTEHAVIDENGKWDVAYSGKRIYGIDTPFYGRDGNIYGCTQITSLEFTDNMSELVVSSREDSKYRQFLYGLTNCTELKFARGTTFSKLTKLYNGFAAAPKLVELDLKDATFESVNDASNAFCAGGELKTLKLNSLNFKQSNGVQNFNNTNCVKLENIEIAKNSIYDSWNIGKSPNITKQSVLNLINAAAANVTYTLHSTVYSKCASGGEWYTDIQAAIDARAQQGYTVTLISA